MADKVTFELVSPERVLLSVEAEMVVVPGSEGDFAVLAGHQPTISALRPGSIDVYEAGDRISSRIFVAGGLAEVSLDRLTVLAEAAERFESVDRAALGQRIAEATEAIEDAGADEVKRDAAETRLAYLQHIVETNTVN
ncbi:ATP synthase F1 subunit epsilon [Desertibaculum subflavum]|uniref:ATP synthase F1 subunit epsilon n=1 Tax=Desertibaculum subflavum TaxID=2268458 RepID=UPI000E65F97C